MRARCLVGLAVCLATAIPARADRCTINLVSHGTFRVVAAGGGACLQFVDDTGATWEITNPRGSWTDGLSGTVLAEFAAQGTCSQAIGEPLRVCSFTADFSGNVVGTLIFRDFVECPGYRIRTENEDFLITNCDDFGAELCAPGNLGRRVQAQIVVDSGPSICIDSITTVIEFHFLQ